ncbi:MAG: hypothetical protein Q8L34_00125 [Candidatus Woesearchaeota archaeon]|nr:hypothetical protein [Candidatus Woesearchaeota archaeon]
MLQFPYYLVLGTHYKNSRDTPAEIRAPWQIFRIDGPRAYAQCVSTQPSNFDFTPLEHGMLYAKVFKWIVLRALPSTPAAPGIVTDPRTLENMLLRQTKTKKK